ncbi:zinc finger protein 431-like [Ostrinia furnacalis]|uniref:zinc finger protein 431-like n=1 Tax=Ostrinia furnacalis TaxID=93504 RepID=UPI001039FDC3|nr:zinc finger protein 431-like [Ostrinia furnacalis]
MTSLLLIKSMLLANALKKSHKKKKRKVKKSHCIKKIVNPCRICSEESGEIPIFNNIIHPNIPEDIKNISGIALYKMENYSNHMCQSCLDLLNGCIMFRELCQRSNAKITELYEKKEYGRYERDKTINGDSEDSYHASTPTYSEDNSEVWGCSTCNKEFDNMAEYNKHASKCSLQTQSQVAKPSGEVTKKKFLCDTCGKTACSNASLLVHMATHENVFPFKCEECPYQGRTMDLLKVHKRSHMADKPFKCTQCPKATTTSSNLAKHMRHVHSTTRPFKCTYCEKAFSYQHDMKRHIKDIHLRQGTVECDVCFKKFNTKKILQGHRWKIHKIKGERQGRLPSYLQCQIEVHPNENNLNDCEQIYSSMETA